MKRLVTILLILILALVCVPALATGTNGQGDTVARNGELAAFLDGSGNIYVSGLDKPVNTIKADSLLSIDPYRILFFSQAEGDANRQLVQLRLDGFVETTITGDAFAACLDADSIYYISRANSNALKRYDLDSGATATVHTSAEPLERVYATQDGVIVTLVEGAGAYILDEVRGQFVPFSGDVASEIAAFDGFEVYRADSGNLYVLERGKLIPTQVDSSVQDWAVIGGTVYYLSGSASSLTLKSYEVQNALWNTILTPSADMEAQLTASQNALFMLSKGNVVYSVDVKNRTLVNFATLPSLQSYALSGSKSIERYRIEAVSGQLNVYGVVNDASTLPAFTFVDFTSEIVEDTSSSFMLLSAYAIDGESTVWDLLQPAPQYSTLRRGSRGDAVSAIQEPLHGLGYYNYYIDGIFGWRTERAVKLVQADLGLPITGVAGEELQRTILSGGLSPYDPYKALSRGSRGLRVTEMQQRLRDLGYLADSADGIFGPRTQRAVELFQEENGLRVTGEANSDTLRLLFSGSADACSSYIDLQRGDSGYRVRELNRRLKDLYYLEGEVGSSYNSATAEAVRRFQEEVGLKQTGRATAAVQQELFSRNAPEYSGYITLRRGDENARVKDLQRRLTELGYYGGNLDGYFGKSTAEAVKAFQRKVGFKATGVADPNTLAALYRSDAPAYQEPEKIGVPVIELSAYSKFENGIFRIADSDATDGSVTASWFAEGDVASYDISIVDDRNVVYTDSRNVDMTIASIPLTSLDPDRTYTITVTAHPVDVESDSDTTASIRFMRVEEALEPDPGELGTIGKLIVTPEGENIIREDGIYRIPSDSITFKWSADGSVHGYAYVIRDEDGNIVDQNADIEENLLGVGFDAAAFEEGKTYTLTVYAVPTNGTIEDATVESIAFRLKAQDDPTPEPTAEPTAPASPEETPAPEATEAPAESEAPEVNPTEAPAETETPEMNPTETPAESEAPVENPTEAPAAEPAPVTGTPELSVTPNNGSVEMEVSLPEGGTEVAPVTLVNDGSLQLVWMAEGDVAGYNVQIMDASGQDVINQNLTNPGATVNSENLTPGAVYTMTVTAYFNNADTTTSATLRFMRPAPEPTEAPAEEPYEEPAAESVEEPYVEPAAESVEEPYVEEPAPEPVEVPYVEEPVPEPVEEPYVEEPAPEPVEEPYVEEPAPEPVEEPYAEPDPEPVEVPYVEEPEPEPVEEPNVEEPAPEPVEEPYVEPEPEPVEEPATSYSMSDPNSWSSAIDAQSDSAAIGMIQARLTEWGWLGGGYSSGTLDGATVQAVIDFQNACNESGLSVSVTDASNPTIDVDTLRLLFNADGMALTR